MTKVTGLSGLVSLDAAVYAHHLTFRSPGYPCRGIAGFESLTMAQSSGYVSSDSAARFADEIASNLGVTIRADGQKVGLALARLDLEDIRDGVDFTASTYSRERVAFHAMYLLGASLCLEVKRGGGDSIREMSFDIEDLLYIYSAKAVSHRECDHVIGEAYTGLIWLNRLLQQIDAFERKENLEISFQGHRVLDRAPGQQRADMLFALADHVPVDDFDVILLGGWEMFRDGHLGVFKTNDRVDLAEIVEATRAFLES